MVNSAARLKVVLGDESFVLSVLINSRVLEEYATCAESVVFGSCSMCLEFLKKTHHLTAKRITSDVSGHFTACSCFCLCGDCDENRNREQKRQSRGEEVSVDGFCDPQPTKRFVWEGQRVSNTMPKQIYLQGEA